MTADDCYSCIVNWRRWSLVAESNLTALANQTSREPVLPQPTSMMDSMSNPYAVRSILRIILVASVNDVYLWVADK